MEPMFWLTYPGQFTVKVLGHIVGPSATQQRETWGAVAVEYDPATDKSRIGYIEIADEEILNGVQALRREHFAS